MLEKPRSALLPTPRDGALEGAMTPEPPDTLVLPAARSHGARRRRRASTATLLLAAGLCCASLAWVPEAAAGPSLSFDGFGTVGVVHSNEDRADFVSAVFAADGAGHTRDWSPEVDSRLGLQLGSEFSSRLSGIVQVVVEQRYDDTYKPTLEWANIRFEATQRLTLRAGRMVLPSFLTSEYRKVGYASSWVRPPPEVYQLNPVTSFDGIALSYRRRLGDYDNRLHLSFGSKDGDLPRGGELEARNGFTVAHTLERGAATLFTSYTYTRVTIDEFAPLFNAFRSFGPEGRAIAARYDADDTPFQVFSLGASYDPGEWYVKGETALTESRSYLADSRAWYLNGGYRIAAVTPYLELAQAWVVSNASDPGLDDPEAQGLNAALNELLADAAEQKRIAVGARWDFTPSMALKLQVDYLDLDAGSAGVLVNPQPDFRRGGSVTLISFALDFVF